MSQGTDPAFTRRASYGASSPRVGRRGARTRQRIVGAALGCFAEHGYRHTSIDDIASRAEVSRATLYQYFESKDAVFLELMYESGGAIARLTEELGELGPTADGYAHLYHWLAEFAGVFDRYASMFIEWAHVNKPNAPVRPKLARFNDVHTQRFGAALQAAGYTEQDGAIASILVLALAGRVYYIHHVYGSGVTDLELLDSLATAIQLYLFPTTDDSVLSDRPPLVEWFPTHRAGPFAGRLPARSEPRPGPFDGVSEQAAVTVRQLLDAAGRVFAAHGYDVATVDHIVAEAGLARGTFYRYFQDKLALMTALAAETAAVMCPMFEELGRIAPLRDGPRLREWLHRFLVLQRGHAGVLRAWVEGFPVDPVVLAPSVDVVAALDRATRATFGPRRRYPLHPRAAVPLLNAALEGLPNQAAGTALDPDDATIVEAQAQFIERVLLPPQEPSR